MDILFTVIMVIVIIFAILLVGVRLFGITPYTVISGSMEPEYPVGSMVYVKKVTASELKVNDTITYVIPGETVVTHRIIEIIPDEDNPTVVRYRTKGDANDSPDGDPVHINNVLGKVVFCIPIIGYISHFIQHPPGTYIMIILIAGLILLSFLPGIYEKLKVQANAESATAEAQIGTAQEEKAELSIEGQNPDGDQKEKPKESQDSAQNESN